MAKAQEEFVAILGHDLRNPVAALNSGFRLLSKEPLDGRANELIPMMRSSVYRMIELIDNMMIHAKARLGGGLRVSRTADAPLSEAIAQVVEEIRTGSPDIDIHLDLAFEQPVFCDAPRVAQAISNMLSNAVRHGSQNTPIEVKGTMNADSFEISVMNQGEPVPDELRQNLFHPFRRGSDTQGEGLGLGLYIASSIALAHDGKIDVGCENGTTRFTFRAPAKSSA